MITAIIVISISITVISIIIMISIMTTNPAFMVQIWPEAPENLRRCQHLSTRGTLHNNLFIRCFGMSRCSSSKRDVSYKGYIGENNCDHHLICTIVIWWEYDPETRYSFTREVLPKGFTVKGGILIDIIGTRERGEYVNGDNLVWSVSELFSTLVLQTLQKLEDALVEQMVKGCIYLS